MSLTIWLTGRLNDLGGHLIELTGQVRQAVAEAVSETAARMARDAVAHLMFRRPPERIRQSSIDEYDPWTDSAWEIETGRSNDEVDYRAQTSRDLFSTPLLAALVGVAGVSFLWHGSLSRAVLIGLAALLIGKRRRILDVALELAALTHCLTNAGKALVDSESAEAARRRTW